MIDEPPTETNGSGIPVIGAIPIVTLAFSAALVLDALVEVLDRVKA